MSISVAQSNVAYISLQPQTYPGGTTATITNQRSAASVTTPMVDGGIDPVPVIANAGDGISLAIQTTEGSVIATVNTSVPSRRPPKIVRTIPGRGKTGVPLNKNIVVVFTEPVAENSLAASVKLFRGNAAVSGTAAILEGTTAAIVFKPAANLEANANYELVVTNGVRDLDGDPADSVVRVSFTTGASIEGPAASASIIPDGADLTVGEQFQAVVVAKDAAGNILTGYPVKWSADSSAVEVTTSGLVTARHTGVGTVFAGVNDQVGAVIGVRVFDTLPAVTSVIVAFDSALVSSGTLLVGAIAIDADGNLLERRLLEWSSSNSGVATVAATSNDQIGNVNIDRIWFHGYVVPQSAVYWAKVSGIANGVARIVATAEGHSGTTVITVAPSSPVVGFVLSDTSTLLLHQAAPVSGYSVNAAGGRTSLPPAQIQWESSDPSVATVDAEGIITALATGSATITGRWNNYAGSIRIAVVEVTFEAMSAGGTHTCALAAGGATYCWGANEFGQSGRPGLSTFSPSKLFYSTPVPVAKGFSFVAITASGGHSCGLTAGGTAYCWGYNGEGEVGWGNFVDSWRPVPVSGGLSFATIKAAGAYTCGLTATGAAYCWGWNYWGQLGSSSQVSSVIPSQISSPVPLPVSGGITFAQLTTGGSHACGLTAGGAAYCWGWNGDGELGIGTFGQSSATPLAVSGGLTFTSISAGYGYTCGLTRSGSAYCWGVNGDDQLGNGIEHGSSAVPVPVAGNLSFSTIGAGSATCALDAAGIAYCWGWNRTGQIGVGTVSSDQFATPQRVVGGHTFDRLMVGGSQNCARTSAGVWYCWGDNESGALGVGTFTNSGTPLKVLGQQ